MSAGSGYLSELSGATTQSRPNNRNVALKDEIDIHQWKKNVLITLRITMVMTNKVVAPTGSGELSGHNLHAEYNIFSTKSWST